MDEHEINISKGAEGSHYHSGSGVTDVYHIRCACGWKKKVYSKEMIEIRLMEHEYNTRLNAVNKVRLIQQ